MTQYIQAFSIYRHEGDSFPVLPDKWQRETLATLVDRAAQWLDVSREALHTFRVMLSKTVPAHFTDPSREPVCYASQVELAHELGLSDRHVRRHEAELLRAGLIEKRTMANGARSGFHGCGIYFSAAISLVPRLMEQVAAMDADRRRAAGLRGQRSTHLRHIKGALDELRPTCAADPEFQAFEEALAGWPSARTLHRLSLEALEAHVAEADDLCRRVLDYLEKTLDMSAQADEYVRPYIQDTTQESDLSCNASVNKRTSGTPEDADSVGAGPNGPTPCLERKYEEASEAHKNEFMEKLSPRRLYHLCSDNMRLHIDVRKGERYLPNAHDFEMAAISRLPELGINYSAWTEACRQMGPAMATICVILTDAHAAPEVNMVRNPGGYLRALTRAHKNGTLNIIGGLIGLNERRRHQHEE